jgi:RES domain-containing protein
MLVYRITFKTFSNALLAPGLAGRWNSAGHKVIYAAQSIELAFLESMIRRKGVGFNADFRTMIIEIPDKIKMDVINENDLEKGWRDFRDYSKCQPLGNDWYDRAETAVLKVPSAVLPHAFNYVFNSMHSNYKSIKLLKVIDLVPDQRIEDI